MVWIEDEQAIAAVKLCGICRCLLNPTYLLVGYALDRAVLIHHPHPGAPLSLWAPGTGRRTAAVIARTGRGGRRAREASSPARKARLSFVSMPLHPQHHPARRQCADDATAPAPQEAHDGQSSVRQ